jgi:NMD protein affecting ribosome stability and mRNA decay
MSGGHNHKRRPRSAALTCFRCAKKDETGLTLAGEHVVCQQCLPRERRRAATPDRSQTEERS